MFIQIYKNKYFTNLLGIFIFIILLTTTSFAASIPTELFPKSNGYITDEANVLTLETKQKLENQLINIKNSKSVEIAVVTVLTLNDYPIDDFTLELGRHWGVGSKETDSGIVFLIAPIDKQVRIEVGYGLEPSLTDLQSYQIIENIIPYFKNNQFDQAIEIGVNQIIETLNLGTVPSTSQQNTENFNPFVLAIYFLIFGLSWIGGILGRSKSIWAGGIIGAITGLFFTIFTSLSTIFIFIGFIIGLVFDLIVSKNYNSNKKSWWAGGNRDWWDSNGRGGGFGGGGSSGGGGFGGGSFGGGGASGRW